MLVSGLPDGDVVEYRFGLFYMASVVGTAGQE